jgi:hypothetical protein
MAKTTRESGIFCTIDTPTTIYILSIITAAMTIGMPTTIRTPSTIKTPSPIRTPTIGASHTIVPMQPSAGSYSVTASCASTTTYATSTCAIVRTTGTVPIHPTCATDSVRGDALKPRNDQI